MARRGRGLRGPSRVVIINNPEGRRSSGSRRSSGLSGIQWWGVVAALVVLLMIGVRMTGLTSENLMEKPPAERIADVASQAGASVSQGLKAGSLSSPKPPAQASESTESDREEDLEANAEEDAEEEMTEEPAESTDDAALSDQSSDSEAVLSSGSAPRAAPSGSNARPPSGSAGQLSFPTRAPPAAKAATPTRAPVVLSMSGGTLVPGGAAPASASNATPPVNDMGAGLWARPKEGWTVEDLKAGNQGSVAVRDGDGNLIPAGTVLDPDQDYWIDRPNEAMPPLAPTVTPRSNPLSPVRPTVARPPIKTPTPSRRTITNPAPARPIVPLAPTVAPRQAVPVVRTVFAPPKSILPPPPQPTLAPQPVEGPRAPTRVVNPNPLIINPLPCSIDPTPPCKP